jgi:hypothetical protein
MGRACNVWERSAGKGLIGKPEGKRLIGRRRRRWENIKIDIGEIGWRVWAGFMCSEYGPLTRVDKVMNPRVPLNAGNFLSGRAVVDFSRRTLRHRIS